MSDSKLEAEDGAGSSKVLTMRILEDIQGWLERRSSGGNEDLRAMNVLEEALQ
jgi:hypothetical protein